MTKPKAANPAPQTGVRGGYQPPAGGKKPAAPKTGSGVAKAKSTAVVVHKFEAPRSMLELIAQASRDPAVDVGKMRELLAMKREEEVRAAEISFNRALKKAQTGVPHIVKDGKGDRNITYAKLESVSRAVDPLLRDNGFTISWSMDECPIPECYRIVGILSHDDGHSRRYFADIPVSITGPKGAPIMTKAQGAGAAVSFGRRYLKIMILDINIIGEDINAAARTPIVGEPCAPEEVERLIDLAGAAMCPRERLIGFLNNNRPANHPALETLADLPKSRYDEAVTAIRGWEEAQKAKRKEPAGA